MWWRPQAESGIKYRSQTKGVHPLHQHNVMAPLCQAEIAMQQQHQHAYRYQVPKNNIHIAYVHVTILISPIKAAIHIMKTA